MDPAGGGIQATMPARRSSSGERDAVRRAAGSLHACRSSPARVARLGQQYNHALVAVERNNQGHSVLTFLTMECGYQNLYPGGEKIGWVTDRQTRPAMLSRLEGMLAKSDAAVP